MNIYILKTSPKAYLANIWGEFCPQNISKQTHMHVAPKQTDFIMKMRQILRCFLLDWMVMEIERLQGWPMIFLNLCYILVLPDGIASLDN